MKMNSEQENETKTKVPETEAKQYDLENETDLTDLSAAIKTDDFFKLDEGVSYKIKLTSPKVTRVVKDFDGDKVVKYAIQVEAKGSDNSSFKGIWEVGTTILNSIVKDSKATFNVSRTGTGKKTRYSITKDF